MIFTEYIFYSVHKYFCSIYFIQYHKFEYSLHFVEHFLHAHLFRLCILFYLRLCFLFSMLLMTLSIFLNVFHTLCITFKIKRHDPKFPTNVIHFIKIYQSKRNRGAINFARTYEKYVSNMFTKKVIRF